MNKKAMYLIGIDEAGRGPLAGPVAVGAVCLAPSERYRISLTFAKGKIRDSKKLSAEKRERIFSEIKKLKQEGQLDFAVALISHTVIDKQGIVAAIKMGIMRCLDKIIKHRVLHKNCRVLLDGGLKAPVNYLNQKTIIKGDEKELVIALASIAAKVTRDQAMIKLAKKYPHYELEKHKGYGTKLHYATLKKNGLSPIHRRSFLKSFAPPPAKADGGAGKSTDSGQE